IDGVPLQLVAPDTWRSRTRACFQDHLRLEFMLQESVGVGQLTAIDDEIAVMEALQRAGASELPTRFSSGLDTQLGAVWGGDEPSGGQWQQVSLGRSLMRTEVLLTIFDEPTSALDARAEHELFERFSAAARAEPDRSAVTLLVSHRFSTVRQADLILVMDKGCIVEYGSHDNLMANHGLYADLFALQAASYR
ncbi:MAG: ABC transporter ATP-binding protein, partial [Candidatus Dormibacteria bacterium]